MTMIWIVSVKHCENSKRSRSEKSLRVVHDCYYRELPAEPIERDAYSDVLPLKI